MLAVSMKMFLRSQLQIAVPNARVSVTEKEPENERIYKMKQILRIF
jgi:hypothetical protein